MQLDVIPLFVLLIAKLFPILYLLGEIPLTFSLTAILMSKAHPYYITMSTHFFTSVTINMFIALATTSYTQFSAHMAYLLTCSNQIGWGFNWEHTTVALKYNYSMAVGPDGLEPSTHGLKVRCSTD